MTSCRGKGKEGAKLLFFLLFFLEKLHEIEKQIGIKLCSNRSTVPALTL